MKIFLFLLLLTISNLFLFTKGLWFYQDQSFWSKNVLEAVLYLNTQLHAFTNFSYYLGYDQGILSANNIVVYIINLIFVYFMGAEGSQIIASLFGYILSFFSFYLFSSLFFKDKKVLFILSLIFTFNPLLYSFRGYGYIYSVAPLFMYSFYKYYFSNNHSGIYLLINLFSISLWLANVRFLQLNLFIIIPYLLYLWMASKEKQINYKKLLSWLSIVLLICLPAIYMLVNPLFEKSLGIFNYGVVYNGFVGRGSFYEMFNPFQSANIFLYNAKVYILLGIFFFTLFLLFLIKNIKKDISVFFVVNLVILILGMFFFEMGYIVGRDIYSLLIKIVPFLTNAPHYGLYIANIPMILLLGILSRKNNNAFLIFTGFFIIISILPFLNLSNTSLKKFPIEKIPQTYTSYFIDPYNGIPESTHYYPYFCWKAEFMESASTPTQCFNRGIRYMPIVNDNPRVISGLEYKFFSDMYLNPNVNNMRITHNLKNVIVAKDIAPGNEGGPLYSDSDKYKLIEINNHFMNNQEMAVKSNNNFAHYYYKDKSKFDFFIYSPQSIVIRKDSNTLFDNSLEMSRLPVVFTEDKQIKNIQKNITVDYKQSSFDTTKYYFRLSNVQNNDPILLHLTQSFKQGWSIIWLSKDEYDSVKCVTDYAVFPITNNKRCEYNAEIIDIGIIRFLLKNPLSNEYHMVGNYIANTWLINPQELPEYTKSERNLYGVLLYRNQIYYVIALISSSIVLLLILIYTLMQEVNNLIKYEKYNKN